MNYSNEDFFIEDITRVKPKKIKSGQKGKVAERQLVNVLNERFRDILKEHPDYGEFSRTIGSGNRWGQNVVLSKSAKDTYTGDIVSPGDGKGHGFKFTIESKSGYNNIDLCSLFDGHCKEFDVFLKQVSDDSKRCGRKELLIWKKDRKSRLATIKLEEIDLSKYKIYLIYKDWVILKLDDLLLEPDDFFFG